MKRFIEFYSEELKRKVKLLADISMVCDESKQMIEIEIPQQKYVVANEVTYKDAIWSR